MGLSGRVHVHRTVRDVFLLKKSLTNRLTKVMPFQDRQMGFHGDVNV